MKQYKVYCHTNKTNGKKYVGITGKNVEDRWRRGEGYANNAYFYKAIIKHGWDGFTHEILYTVTSEEEALQIERELIEKWNTCNKNYGYNILNGGNLNSEENIKILIDAKVKSGAIRKVVNVETKEVYLGATDASRKTGIDATQITGVCIRKKNAFTAGGFHWCFEDDLPNYVFPESHRVTKAIINIDTGERYSSIREASRETGIFRNQLADVCNGKLLSAGGYHWKYEGSPNVTVERKPLGKRVVNLDTGEEYSTIKEAADSVGTTLGNIAICCKGKTKTAKGFRWAYVEKEEANKYKKRAGMNDRHRGYNKKCVRNIDTGEEYNSIVEAALAVGVAYNNISSACRGKTKTSAGYRWEYIN